MPFFAEKQQVVAGEQGEVDFRDDGAVVADDAGEQLITAGQSREEVVVDFAFDRFGSPTRFPELAEIGRFGRARHARFSSE